MDIRQQIGTQYRMSLLDVIKSQAIGINKIISSVQIIHLPGVVSFKYNFHEPELEIAVEINILTLYL
jgi:hypothetical protein